MTWHLAELNVARVLAPLDDPRMAPFVAGLDEINAIADRAPGFVWRYRDDTLTVAHGGHALGEDVLVNLSVWESFESLRAYVYDTPHAAFLRERRQWFVKLDAPGFVMWWVPAGTLPTLAEAIERLQRLRAEGPSPEAFDPRNLYPPPDASR